MYNPQLGHLNATYNLKTVLILKKTNNQRSKLWIK